MSTHKNMKSESISLYSKWVATATPEQVEFVDAVFDMAEINYERGGDVIVECFGPEEIIEDFESLNDAKEFCGVRIEAALNARWGEDTDPELAAAKRFKEWVDA